MLRRPLPIVLLIAFAARGASRPEKPIFVDARPFATPSVAAEAEYSVPWNGRDERRKNACTESFAAVELQRYLARLLHRPPEAFPAVSPVSHRRAAGFHILSLTDVPLPERAAAIVAREGLREKLRTPESFALVPDGQALYLIGSDRVGALYAVYEFLEMQGVRWYAPGEDGEYVPSVRDVQLPRAVVVQAPKMRTRGFWAYDRRGNYEFFLWMARNRLNFWTNVDPRRPLLKKLGVQLIDGAHDHFMRYVNPHASLDGRRTNWEAHPEWYGLSKGKRCPFENVFGMNPCTSNDEMVAQVVKGTIRELATGDWRDADWMNFWGLDSHLWCTCDKCLALGTPTDRMLRMVHQLRQGIVKAMARGELTHNVRIVFPMYHETLPPPTRPLPEGFDYANCVGTMAPISRCYIHNMDDPDCTEFNVPLWRKMSGWKEGPGYYKGDFFLCEYYNISDNKSLPVLFTRTMTHDIPAFYRLGSRHMYYMHVPVGFEGPKRWTNYLFARLLWDPQTPVAPVFEQYLRDFYGPAAGEMAPFYEHLETGMSAVTSWRGYRPNLITQLRRDLDPEGTEHLKIKKTATARNQGVSLEESVEHLRQCRAIMDGLLARPWPDRLHRVLDDDERNLRYGEHTAEFYYRVAQAASAKRAGRLEEARGFYRLALPSSRALEQEMDLPRTSCAECTAKNGLDATRIEEYFRKLGQELGVGN
jgi:hypothetical protein